MFGTGSWGSSFPASLVSRALLVRWQPLAASGALRLVVVRRAVRAGALAAAGGQ
jgi:hypothetical protein